MRAADATTARTLVERFRATRAHTEALAAPLSDEDQVLQSMPAASPTKWHRAHTTWFFETFLLAPAGVAPVDERFGHLFNSYYDSIGDRVARDKRGLLSRPTVAEVTAYRRAVDARVCEHLERTPSSSDAVRDIVELGLAHEEQHQELILTDILHALAQNPVAPIYATDAPTPASRRAVANQWRRVEGGVVDIGARDALDDASFSFAFDNERPRHRVFLAPYEIAAHVVTVGDVRAFIRERGYATPSLWLSQGFEVARAGAWRAPLYWHDDALDSAGARAFTLRGLRALADDEPAAHLSFWEAEAIARFLGARLPTECEWEHAVVTAPIIEGAYDDVWQWTRSSYEPYPGFAPAAGAVGEYNGKFMAQQYVLRGASCFTPRGHSRATYRNFWHPDTRFQMAGLRLARDAR